MHHFEIGTNFEFDRYVTFKFVKFIRKGFIRFDLFLGWFAFIIFIEYY